MNYHTLVYIKWLIGIITIVLILFFVNPYQDYVLGIGGLLLGLILILWAIWYLCSLTLYRRYSHDSDNAWIASYMYGLFGSIGIVSCILVMIVYNHRWLTLWVMWLFVLLIAIVIPIWFPFDSDLSEDIY